jgi:hypothetical protein
MSEVQVSGVNIYELLSLVKIYSSGKKIKVEWDNNRSAFIRLLKDYSTIGSKKPSISYIRECILKIIRPTHMRAIGLFSGQLVTLWFILRA